MQNASSRRVHLQFAGMKSHSLKDSRFVVDTTTIAREYLYGSNLWGLTPSGGDFDEKFVVFLPQKYIAGGY